MSTSPRAQLRPLTSLRFFAAVYVVIFHYWTSYHLSATRPLIVELGYTGVTFFFILSGFILSYSHEADGQFPPEQRRRYFVARFARIYPVYIATILVMYPGLLPSLAFSALDHVLRLLWAVSSPFALQAWIPGAACSLNCPNWSISAEAFFYALFPIVFATVYRHAKTALPLIGLAMIVTWTAQMIGWQWTGRSLTQMANIQPLADPVGDLIAQFIFYFPPMRLAEFLLGICLYSLWQKGGRNIPAAYLYAVALAGAIAVYLVAPVLPENVLRNGFATLCYMPLIIAAANTKTGPLNSRLLVWLGQISFALYLIHSPVDSYMRTADGLVFGAQLSTMPILFLTLSSGVALLAAAFLYHVIEEPSRRAIMRRLSEFTARGRSARDTLANRST
ncbi:MAG: acyltransferase family protein [Pannonibacter sp.]